MAVLDTMTPKSTNQPTKSAPNQTWFTLWPYIAISDGEEENTRVRLIAGKLCDISVATAYVTNKYSMAMSTINHPISIDSSVFSISRHCSLKLQTNCNEKFPFYTHRYRSAAPRFFISLTSNLCHQMNLKCFTIVLCATHFIFKNAYCLIFTTKTISKFFLQFLFSIELIVVGRFENLWNVNNRFG